MNRASLAPQPQSAADLLGTCLESYQLERVLGAGGMGTVYLGRHSVIGSKVAVKVLHACFRDDGDAVERFVAEARAVNLIGHDNIVKIFDLNTTSDGRPYCVMEYLEGKPLGRMLDGALPIEHVAPILYQLIDALAAAHDRGIVHRDLKPDNIFLIEVAGRTVVKILDFGIAKLHAAVKAGHESWPAIRGAIRAEPTRRPGSSPGGDRSSFEKTPPILGTPQYMAPEQAAGEEVDARADVYALGVILYRIVTGRLPFSGRPVAQILMAQVVEPPPAPRSIAPEISRPLEALILKALAKRQEARFQSVLELGAALKHVIDGVEAAPLRSSAGYSVPVLTPKPERRPESRAETPVPPPEECVMRYYRDAVCAMYVGRVLQARRALERALAIDPRDADVHQLLWELRTQPAS